MPNCGSPMCCGPISPSPTWKRRWQASRNGSGALADDNSVEVPVKVKTSDLGVRTASAVVMLAVAGGVLWLGGWPWRIFAALVAAGVLWEWRRLVQAFAAGPAALAAWNIAGILYIGLAAATLMALREGANGFLSVLTVVAMVIATDVGAYF